MKDVRKYSLSISFSEENGENEFVAVFDDFKTIIGVGSTAKEAIEEAYDNLDAYFEFCEEDGIAIPEPSKNSIFQDYNGRVTLRMPRTLHRDISNYAKKDGLSLNYIINDALRFYLNNLSLKDVTQEISLKIDSCIFDLSAQINHLTDVKIKNDMSFSNDYYTQARPVRL